MELENIINGIIVLVLLYIISVICNIRIVKGEYGFLPGTFKLYFFAVIASVICNFIGVICAKRGLTFFYGIKIIIILLVLSKIHSLKTSGDPRWVADYKDVYAREFDPDIPFTSTEGMAFCIMSAYTLPTEYALMIVVMITIIQGLYDIEKYKFQRSIVLCCISGLETIAASWFIQVSCELDVPKALFAVATIGMVFNILLGSLNGIILDLVVGTRFIKD